MGGFSPHPGCRPQPCIGADDGDPRLRLGAVRLRRVLLDLGGKEQGVRVGGAGHRPDALAVRRLRTNYNLKEVLFLAIAEPIAGRVKPW